MRNRTLKLFAGTLFLFLLVGCSKSNQVATPATHSSDAQYVKYTIRAGQQYCDQSVYKQTNYAELKFVVKFDSTAVYQTASSNNQLDVNKLFGFSDNNSDHHQFSARFGWRWSDHGLHLFAYTYNSGEMTYEELGTITIGAEYNCSIKVTGDKYIFTLNDCTKTMERASATTTAVGYMLYPYFGGDEVAPHDINIWIKELP